MVCSLGYQQQIEGLQRVKRLNPTVQISKENKLNAHTYTIVYFIYMRVVINPCLKPSQLQNQGIERSNQITDKLYSEPHSALEQVFEKPMRKKFQLQYYENVCFSCTKIKTKLKELQKNYHFNLYLLSVSIVFGVRN